MDSYIVRIYRRNPQDHAHVVGIVETVERGTSASFTDMRGLWDILAAVSPKIRRRPRKERPKMPNA